MSPFKTCIALEAHALSLQRCSPCLWFTASVSTGWGLQMGWWLLLKTPSMAQNTKEERRVNRVAKLFVLSWQFCILTLAISQTRVLLRFKATPDESVQSPWCGPKSEDTNIFIVRMVSFFISFQNPSVRFALFYFCSSITFKFNFLFTHLTTCFFCLVWFSCLQVHMNYLWTHMIFSQHLCAVFWGESYEGILNKIRAKPREMQYGDACALIVPTVEHSWTWLGKPNRNSYNCLL